MGREARWWMLVYRSLYFFTGAYQRGEASDPTAYLAAKAERNVKVARIAP